MSGEARVAPKPEEVPCLSDYTGMDHEFPWYVVVLLPGFPADFQDFYVVAGFTRREEAEAFRRPSGQICTVWRGRTS